MTISVLATQRSNSVVRIEWTSTDPIPGLGYQIRESVNAGPEKILGGVIAESTFVAAPPPGWVVGDSVEYVVEDLDTTTTGKSPAVILRDLDVPFTYGPVDPTVTSLRYTTLALLKQSIGSTTTVDDDLVEQAGIAAEIQIDQTLGRSFPDQGDNPEIGTVPVPIQQLALRAGVAAWKATQAPFGSLGSDSFLGAVAAQTEIDRELRTNALMRGYRLAWGVA